MKNYKMTGIKHPGQYLIQEIRDRGWTQKHFSQLLGKKVSEVNELIKGKRNITIQWDILLSNILGSPEKLWMNRQIDYDYHIAKTKISTMAQSEQKKVANNAVLNQNEKMNHEKHENIFRNF